MLITVNVALVSTRHRLHLRRAALLHRRAQSDAGEPDPCGIIVKRCMELLRAFPEIVIAGLLAAIISIGPVAAIAAVGLHSVGALGKLFYEVIENIDMKADEGMRAVGANWIERVRFGALPQVLPNFMSYTLLRLEINVRASTIIGAVGAVGIGQELKLSISRGFGSKTLALILLLFVTIFIVDQFSAWLRRRLVGEQAFLIARREDGLMAIGEMSAIEKRYPRGVPPARPTERFCAAAPHRRGGALSRSTQCGSSNLPQDPARVRIGSAPASISASGSATTCSRSSGSTRRRSRRNIRAFRCSATIRIRTG